MVGPLRPNNRVTTRMKPLVDALWPRGILAWALAMAGTLSALFALVTAYSIPNAVFAQPEVRHGSNTSFMWTLLGGFKNALRYGLTGDHIDAQEALRIGLVVKVVHQDQLLTRYHSQLHRFDRPERDDLLLRHNGSRF